MISSPKLNSFRERLNVMADDITDIYLRARHFFRSKKTRDYDHLEPDVQVPVTVCQERQQLAMAYANSLKDCDHQTKTNMFDDPVASWTCPKCTYANNGASLFCGICDHPHDE
jgi:rubrerythrin